MRQALHIFKKDVRHLYFEIAVVIFLVAAFTFTDARRAYWLSDPVTNRIGAWTLVMILLPLAWWALIARVIHDEALPGDNQFWITRPYSWKSLLAAKVLFLLAFINLPILLADVIILHAYRLHPFGAELPGLLWSQILLAIVYILPMAALSALTSGFVQLVFAILTPCVIALGIAIAAPNAVIGGFGGSDWVKTYYVFLIIAVAASAILVWQYSARRTTQARFLAAAAAILAVLGLAFIPGSAVFKIQSSLSKQTLEASVARVDFDSASKWLTRAVAEKDHRVRIELPLNIAALPSGMAAKAEGFSVQLHAPDGTTWRADQIPLRYISDMNQKFSLQFTVDDAFYRKIKNEPLTIHGSLYLTLFGDRQSARIPFGDRLVTVRRVGICSASGGSSERSDFLICTSAFRFQPVLVSYRFIQSTNAAASDVSTSTQPRSISYAPFPAEAGINPVSQDFTFSSSPSPFSQALVDTIAPLAYVRRTSRSTACALPTTKCGHRGSCPNHSPSRDVYAIWVPKNASLFGASRNRTLLLWFVGWVFRVLFAKGTLVVGNQGGS